MSSSSSSSSIRKVAAPAKKAVAEPAVVAKSQKKDAPVRAGAVYYEPVPMYYPRRTVLGSVAAHTDCHIECGIGFGWRHDACMASCLGRL